MNHEMIWNSVLEQLQWEMPRASFETWVQDTEALSIEDGVMTVAAHNIYARDWLENRLTSAVQRLLGSVAEQSLKVKFVVHEVPVEKVETMEQEPEDVNVEAVQWLDYDRIVQPHKQVVVKGYLRRLGREIGPKAVWLYIGFHQAAWRAHSKGGHGGTVLHSRDVMRFSGLSSGTFWRLMRSPDIRSQLAGLVQRLDPPDRRTYRRGWDGRPHRIPVRYQVCMTPRLTRSDAAAVYFWLRELIRETRSVSTALQELLAVEDVDEILSPLEMHSPAVVFDTVMEMARAEAGNAYTPEVDRLAQELHRRIINSLGDIHITHYFITETIHRFDLTPAQAWLVTVARDMAYLNARTGERRERVTFQRGYQEMAELIGSKRYKTVQAWLNPAWKTEQRGGDLSRFLVEVEREGANTYGDLRAESMPRSFRVLLDEPLDADGANRMDASGGNTVDANGSHSGTQMGVIVDAGGGNMLDANGAALNTLKHPINTKRKNTSTTQHAQRAAGRAVPDFWELEALLQQNDVHPKVQKELLDVQASVHAFVSWVLYVASPLAGRLSDPLGYALSRLREHPLREARGVFRHFADLPPQELLSLIDATPTQAYELQRPVQHPLAEDWNLALGSPNPRLPAVRDILFGEGDL